MWIHVAVVLSLWFHCGRSLFESVSDSVLLYCCSFFKVDIEDGERETQWWSIFDCELPLSRQPCCAIFCGTVVNGYTIFMSLWFSSVQGSWLDSFVELANNYPYLWALYAVALVIPFVLCAACCVRSKVSPQCC